MRTPLRSTGMHITKCKRPKLKPTKREEDHFSTLFHTTMTDSTSTYGATLYLRTDIGLCLFLSLVKALLIHHIELTTTCIEECPLTILAKGRHLNIRHMQVEAVFHGHAGFTFKIVRTIAEDQLLALNVDFRIQSFTDKVETKNAINGMTSLTDTSLDNGLTSRESHGA